MNDTDEMLWKFGNLLLESVSDYLKSRAKEAKSIETKDFVMELAGEVETAILCKEPQNVN